MTPACARVRLGRALSKLPHGYVAGCPDSCLDPRLATWPAMVGTTHGRLSDRTDALLPGEQAAQERLASSLDREHSVGLRRIFHRRGPSPPYRGWSMGWGLDRCGS